MKKIYFQYIPLNLDVRGEYHPSHVIRVPQLYGKAAVFDESNTPIKTPNTLTNFAYIEVVNEADVPEIQNLLSFMGVAMKEIDADAARQMLEANGYVNKGDNVYEIVPKQTEPTPSDAVNITID